jgi:hypothetical protein
LSRPKIVTESAMVLKSLVAKKKGWLADPVAWWKSTLLKTGPAILMAFAIAAIAPVTSSAGTSDYFATHFFDATQTPANYSVRIDNPTRVTSPLCAMIYVFDKSQTLQECCGCPLRPDQMDTLALTNLTGNPFSTSPVTSGAIDIVASSINHGTSAAALGGCDPAGTLNPTPTLRSWLSNDNAGVADSFLGAPLDSQEIVKLPALCKSSVRIAAPAAICQCGN